MKYVIIFLLCAGIGVGIYKKQDLIKQKLFPTVVPIALTNNFSSPPILDLESLTEKQIETLRKCIIQNPAAPSGITEVKATKYLVFHSLKHKLQIDLDTGHVTWDGGTPDEAARTFWDAVVIAYPSVKERILQEAK